MGSDLWDNAAGNNDVQGQAFAREVLGFEGLNGRASLDGTAVSVDCPARCLAQEGTWEFVNKLNDKQYAVESPDAIRASDSQGFTWLRYGENGLPAAIASDRGGYRTVVLGFPLEAMTYGSDCTRLMQRILEYLQ